jgi:hypothetical protein
MICIIEQKLVIVKKVDAEYGAGVFGKVGVINLR